MNQNYRQKLMLFMQQVQQRVNLQETVHTDAGWNSSTPPPPPENNNKKTFKVALRDFWLLQLSKSPDERAKCTCEFCSCSNISASPFLWTQMERKHWCAVCDVTFGFLKRSSADWVCFLLMDFNLVEAKCRMSKRHKVTGWNSFQLNQHPPKHLWESL